MTVFTVRLLWAVVPHFRQSALVMAVAAAFGVWTVWVVPRDIGAPYALLFFCQLFAASSGFRPAANAGHFDAALVRGATRQQLALCHWALSSGPGCLAWLVVSGVEVWSLGHREAMGGDPTSLTGLTVISNVSWVATLPSTRFLGGAGWLFAMGLLASSSRGRAWVDSVVDSAPPSGLVETVSDLGAIVAVPFLFLVPTARAAAGHPLILLTTAFLSLFALAVGVGWIVVRDFPGEG